ncbi:MAG: hypothetical protein ACRDS0_13495 [Pseudonocardiaceae bacterium]
MGNVLKRLLVGRPRRSALLGETLHKPALRALAFARATRPDVLEAVTMAAAEQETRELLAAWEQRGISVPLKVLEAPYQSALRFKARLLFTPGVIVINMPYRLGVAGQGWLGGESRPVDVAGDPVRSSVAGQ